MTHVDCNGLHDALMYVIKTKNIEAIRYLIKIDENFDQLDNRKKSLKDYANETKNEVIIELINNY